MSARKIGRSLLRFHSSFREKKSKGTTEEGNIQTRKKASSFLAKEERLDGHLLLNRRRVKGCLQVEKGLWPAKGKKSTIRLQRSEGGKKGARAFFFPRLGRKQNCPSDMTGGVAKVSIHTCKSEDPATLGEKESSSSG